MAAVAVLCVTAACSPETAAPGDPAAPIVAGEGGLAGLFDCLREADVTLVSAHRGGPAPGYPENATATFAHTISRNPALIETDVRMTSDGVLVMMHDATLDRTTTCEGAVVETSWRELSTCALVDPDGRRTRFHVERLEDVLAWSKGRTVLKLDVKDDALFARVIEAAKSADALDRVVVITYSDAAVRTVAAFDPTIMIAATLDEPRDLARLRAAGIDLARIVAWTGTQAVEPDLLGALDGAGVEASFGAFSIDKRAEAAQQYRALRAAGVQEIATDRPDAVFAALAGTQDAAAALAACAAGPS